MRLRNLAVALAVTGASACWTFGGSPVATGFSTSVTGSISVTTGTFPPPQVTLHSAEDCKKRWLGDLHRPGLQEPGRLRLALHPGRRQRAQAGGAGHVGTGGAPRDPGGRSGPGSTHDPAGPRGRSGSGSGGTRHPADPRGRPAQQPVDPGVPRGRSGSGGTDRRDRVGDAGHRRRSAQRRLGSGAQQALARQRS